MNNNYRKRKKSSNYRSNRSYKKHPQYESLEKKDGIAIVMNIQIAILVVSLIGLYVVSKYYPSTMEYVENYYNNLINQQTSIDVMKSIDNISEECFNMIKSHSLNGQGGMLPVSSDGSVIQLNGKGGYNPVENISDTEAIKSPEQAYLSPVFISASPKFPIKYGRLTSNYGYRIHPVTDKLDFHTGVDIASQQGSPITASLYGKVAEVGESNIYGNYIVLEHSDNLKTIYSHCNEIIARVGEFVKEGDRIATVGSTGMSTGSHLHIEVVVDDKYVNPYWVYRELQ